MILQREINKRIEELKTKYANEVNKSLGTNLTRKDIVVKPDGAEYDIYLSAFDADGKTTLSNVNKLIKKYIKENNIKENRIITLLQKHIQQGDIKIWLDHEVFGLICSNGWIFFEKYRHINNKVSDFLYGFIDEYLFEKTAIELIQNFKREVEKVYKDRG